jgi:hypothetical protein
VTTYRRTGGVRAAPVFSGLAAAAAAAVVVVVVGLWLTSSLRFSPPSV